MNILLIGGNGFLGESLIKEALKNNINISYLSRHKIKNKELSHINWIQADIFNIEKINIEEKFDVVIHLVGTIKNKNMYKKLNTQSVAKSIELCTKFNINKLVYISANGGFKDYFNSKKQAEEFVKSSSLNYLIVRPGLMYGTSRPTSYLNVLPIKIFSALNISFFKNVYPLPVSKVSEKIIFSLINKPRTNYLNIEDLK